MIKEIPFCIKDVLERPLFHRAKLVAGKNGLNREVKWLHILEVTNAAPYVSKNDLILTTGLWLKRSVEEGLAYMRQIIDHETAGLCIEFGTTIDEIPDEMIRLCDKHDFPIILFRQPVRFEEITQDIHSFLINRHMNVLRNLEGFSRKQQQLILQSSDIPAILRLLHKYTSRQIIYLSSIEPNKFFPSVDSKTAEELNAFCRRELDKEGLERGTHLFKMEDEQFILFQPVVCFGQIFSYVGILLNQASADEYMTVLLDYTAKAVATVLLRTQFIEEKILRHQNELIQDILNRQIDNEEQAKMQMGLRLPEKYLFIGGIVEIDHDMPETSQERIEAINQDMLVLIRALLKKQNLHYLIMIKNNQIHLLCAKEKLNSESPVHFKRNIQAMIAGLKGFVDNSAKNVIIHIGFGKARARLLDTWQSFNEAYQVAEISRTVPFMKDRPFYEDIGVYQILKAVPEAFLTSYVHDHLGDLIAYDKKHHLSLIETLDVYFRNMGSKRETANHLFIHRQTLYNRLEKIKEILGVDFFEPQKRYCLEMALLGFEMVSATDET